MNWRPPHRGAPVQFFGLVPPAGGLSLQRSGGKSLSLIWHPGYFRGVAEMVVLPDWWCRITRLYLLAGLRRLRGELRAKRVKKLKMRIRRFLKRAQKALKPVRWAIVAVLLFALTTQLDSAWLRAFVALLLSRTVWRLRSGRLNFDEFVDEFATNLVATLLFSIFSI